MISVTITDQITFLSFWLIFSRWLGILVQLPLLDETNIPVRVKILLSVLVTYAFFPHLSSLYQKQLLEFGENSFILLTILELLIGLFIGFLAKQIMNIFYAAGSLVSQQIGFAGMRYFDPNSVQSVGPIEILLKWAVVVLILSSGALLPMMKGAFLSFHKINIYTFAHFHFNGEFLLAFFKNIFIAGLLLSSPLLFANLIVMSILGVVARMVPQMNVLMISFVVNIGVGLFVLFLTTNEFFLKAFKLYTESLGQWFKYIS